MFLIQKLINYYVINLKIVTNYQTEQNTLNDILYRNYLYGFFKEHLLVNHSF